jgi:cytochrome c
MKVTDTLVTTALLTLAFGASLAFSDVNSARGQRVFSACAACHSLQPDQNMTGPSLGGVWGRKAGSLASFLRYSPALQSSNIVWNDKTLDDWIADPEHLVPGNQMTFAGIKDARQRADLLAFLKEANKAGSVGRAERSNGRHGRHDGRRTSS